METQQTTKAEDERYNVYIVKIGTGERVRQIGENLTEKQKERRIRTGIARTNSDYFIKDVKVSEDDQ